jgi:t-SNARE complex subunit (syntaxin)
LHPVTAGNDGDIFKIEESSGKIQLNTQFSQSTYTLEVTVSDKGDPVLSATTEITINIDASKNSLTFARKYKICVAVIVVVVVVVVVGAVVMSL